MATKIYKLLELDKCYASLLSSSRLFTSLRKQGALGFPDLESPGFLDLRPWLGPQAMAWLHDSHRAALTI